MNTDNTQDTNEPSPASAGYQPEAYDVVHAEPGLVITRKRRMDDTTSDAVEIFLNAFADVMEARRDAKEEEFPRIQEIREKRLCEAKARFAAAFRSLVDSLN